MNTNAMEVINDLYNLIGGELVEIVKIVEAKPLTTQDHYGDYMDTIPQVVETITKGMRLPLAGKTGYAIVGVMLIRAGANRYGIKNALVALGKL